MILCQFGLCTNIIMTISRNLFTSHSPLVISKRSTSSVQIFCSLQNGKPSISSGKSNNFSHGHGISVSYTEPLQHQHSSRNRPFIVKHEILLNKARVLLNEVKKNSLEALEMVDCIQRFGMEHLFQEEIHSIIETNHLVFTSTGSDYANDDLREAALRFRLLRQKGYFVPCDMFNHFKDKNGGLDKKLQYDMMGLTSIFEASQLGVEEEDVLREAGEMSEALLNASMLFLDYHHAKRVRNTLENPSYKCLANFSNKDHINDIIGSSTWGSTFRELSSLESSRVRSIHQKEILEVSKWWRELGLAKSLKFVRDQPLKWYMWPMAIFTDPKLSQERVELTKPISMIYIIDDIFDVYGTPEELILFTEAVKRWNKGDCDVTMRLPGYMKICFKALDDITNHNSSKVQAKHGWNPVHTLRKSWATLLDAFLVEANWFASKHSPTVDEYLKNAIISSGVHVLLVHIYFLLGDGINKQCVDVLNNTAKIPEIISSTAAILRLWDDLGSAKDEDQAGHDGSFIEYYMKDNNNVSAKEAREHVKYLISNEWKRLTKGCLSPQPFPASFANASLNVARMVPLMYNYDDNHKLPLLQEHMKLLSFGSKEATRF